MLLCALLLAVMTYFIFLKKACFVGEIVCNTQNTENSEQVRWYT